MADIAIRRATAVDRPTVERLAALLQAAEHGMHPSRRAGDSLPRAAVDELWRHTEEEGGAILLAEDTGTGAVPGAADAAVAGYIAFYPQTLAGLELRESAHRFLYVSDLCVVPERRGRGIAGTLLNAAEVACRSAGLPRLAIGVLAANDAARAAYARAGYEPYEDWLEKSIDTVGLTPSGIDGLTLRPAVPADRPTLLNFLRDLADAEAAFHWAMRPGSEITMAEVDRTIREIHDEDGAIVLAELGGRPVGYAGVVRQTVTDEFELKDEWMRRGFITDLFVSAEARRRGVAQALLAACEDHVRAAGIDWLQICVSPDNAPAQALYSRCGFRDYELVLEKRLA